MEHTRTVKKFSIWQKAFPFVMYFAFIVMMPLHKSTTAIYFNMIYYWSLTVFYICTKRFRFQELWKNWTQGKRFWISTALTFLGMLIAYAISILPAMFLNTDDGLAAYRLDGILPVVLFGITLIPLPSIVEESFFRGDIISFKSRKATVITTILGLIMFGFSHTLNPIGAFSALLWAIPLAIAYIKTKNIYIAITAHLISNIIVNGMAVISAALELMNC